jgi:hypothetical protein
MKEEIKSEALDNDSEITKTSQKTDLNQIS